MKEEDFEKTLTLLDDVSERDPNEGELRLVVRRYPDVDVLLEATRFSEWWGAKRDDRLGSLRPFENWLDRARPSSNRSGRAQVAPTSDRWAVKERKLRANLLRARNPQAGRDDDERPLTDEEVETEIEYHRRKFFGELRGVVT